MEQTLWSIIMEEDNINYHQTSVDKFIDLTDNETFQSDLKSFYQGGRYNMSDAEIDEAGKEGMRDKFIEHMRFQSWNDFTAVKDLNYVENPKYNPDGKEAFGKLIQAWDGSDEVGTGVWEGIWDFGESVVKSPSTYGGIGSLGLAKVGAKLATKGVQFAVRNRISDYFKKKALLKHALGGALTGAVVEGSVAGLQSHSAGKTRENLIEGYEHTWQDTAKDVAIAGAVGTLTGGVGGYFTGRQAKNVDDLIAKQQATNKSNRAAVDKVAKETFESVDVETFVAAVDRTLKIQNILAAKKGVKVTLDPLDADRVAMGQAILKGIPEGIAVPEFSSGLSIDALRSITAATLEISKQLNVPEGKRITEAVADRIRDEGLDGGPTSNIINDIKTKYGLTSDQLSLIYLADISDAGRTLAEASIIKKGTQKTGKESLDSLKFSKESVLSDLNIISKTSLSTIGDQRAADIVEEAVSNTVSPGLDVGKGIYRSLQILDQLRIAFMTSQVATTARNVTSTGLLGVVDPMDEMFKAIFAGVPIPSAVASGLTAVGIKTTARKARNEIINIKPKEAGELGINIGFGKRLSSNMISNMTATLRGMSLDSATSSVLKDMMELEMPEAYMRTFHDTMRIELGTKSMNPLAKAGRFVNILNTATDTVFKQGAFFASVDKQLRTMNNAELGLNVKDFIVKNGNLQKLDGFVLEKALDDAKRFTMQRDYYNDTSLFGKGAKAAVKINEKAPFLVSHAVGVPFPRYIANHIEMQADYIPMVGPVIDALNRMSTKKAKGELTFFGDAYKSSEDRYVRSATGVMLIFAGYELAKSKGGEVDYASLEDKIGADVDVGSSVGFLLAPMWIGDQLYRREVGLPTGDLTEIGSVMGGLNDMGFDLSLLENMGELFINYMSDQSSSPALKEDLDKQGGRMVSVLGYPLTIVRDTVGQFNYDAAGSTYNRDVGLTPEGYGETSGVSGIPIRVDMDASESANNIFMTEALKAMPDLESTQMLQSMNGKTDIKIYSILNPMPIGKINPLKRQLTGVAAEPTMTEIQREFNKFKLEEYEYVSSRSIENGVIHRKVTESLSATLNQTFLQWKNLTQTKGILKIRGISYNEVLERAEKNPQDYPIEEAYQLQKAMLDSFVKQTVRQHANFWDEQYDKVATKSKIGYIKNEYLIDLSKNGEDIYNEAAQNINTGNYETSGAFLANAESPIDVANKQQLLMGEVAKLLGKEPFPEVKSKKGSGDVDIIEGDLATRMEDITGRPTSAALQP